MCDTIRLTGLLLLLGNFLLASASAEVESPIELPTDGIWRTPEREGANALYLWLRIHATPVSYQEIVGLCERISKPLSLADLKKLACGKGRNAEVRHGSTADIVKERQPVLVYLDGADGKHGFFALALTVNNDDEVLLIVTSSALIETMSGDDFRRVWTGHYLTTAEDHQVTPWLSVALLVPLALVLKRWRWQERRSRC